MAGIDTRGRRDHFNHRSNSADLGFLVGAAIVAVGLVLLSLALGVETTPDIAGFAAP
jgi:hypothetical protein